MAFGWGGAGGGAADALTQILAERRAAFLQQQAEQERRQAAEESARRFNEQMGLQRQEFDFQREQFGADEAHRRNQLQRQTTEDRLASQTRMNEIGTRHMNELAEGPRQIDLAKLQHTNRLAEIAAQGDETRKTQAVRPAAQSDERTIAVQTMENGKKVTRYLTESQVRGKTFEAPAGGLGASGQQRRALNFYNRAKEASEAVTAIEPTLPQDAFNQARLQYGHNIIQSKEQQQYRQAQRAFTEARLRKDSGAAIPTHEYEADAKTYFAQPGDSPEVAAQKKAMRDALLESMAFEAGPAFEEFYGEPFKRQTPTDKTQTGTVRMRAPNGQEQDVPANQVEHFKARGAAVVQ